MPQKKLARIICVIVIMWPNRKMEKTMEQKPKTLGGLLRREYQKRYGIEVEDLPRYGNNPVNLDDLNIQYVKKPDVRPYSENRTTLVVPTRFPPTNDGSFVQRRKGKNYRGPKKRSLIVVFQKDKTGDYNWKQGNILVQLQHKVVAWGGRKLECWRASLFVNGREYLQAGAKTPTKAAARLFGLNWLYNADSHSYVSLYWMHRKVHIHLPDVKPKKWPSDKVFQLIKLDNRDRWLWEKP